MSAGSLSITVGNSIRVSSGILVSNVEIASITSGSGDDVFTATNTQTLCGLYGRAGSDALVFNAAFAFGVHIGLRPIALVNSTAPWGIGAPPAGAFTDNCANVATFVPTNWHAQAVPFLAIPR